jgi:hypothetical protein
MPDPINPEDVTPEENVEPIVEPVNPEAPAEPVIPNEWEDKYQGQLKVNRDLETKLKNERKAREALELQNAPAEEQAAAKARAEVEAEVTAKANARILKSELRAAATGKLADPADAALFIDVSKFEVTDDGDVDLAALNEAIADLIERKPHLAAQKQTRFDGAADQGAKNKDAATPQWTEADLARADAAGDSDGIAKARAEGKLNRLLGIPT